MKTQKEWNSKLVDSNPKGGAPFLELGKQLLNKSKLGNAEEVLDLISRGAPFATDWVGTCPLHWAAFYNHVEVAETLLMAGICRDAKNKVNRTPLHVAAQKGHHQVIQVLLNYGADVNCKDILKMTPLHWAAESGSRETVQLLLDYGADIFQTSVFDKSATMIAKDCNHHEILNIIEATSALEPSVRAATLRVLRRKSKAQFSCNKPQIEIPATQNFSPLRLKVVPKTQKIGVLVGKENPITGERRVELIKNEVHLNNKVPTHAELLRTHAIIYDSNNGPLTTLPTIINGQTSGLSTASNVLSNSSNIIRPNSIKVISDAKLTLSEPKLTVPDGKLAIPDAKFSDTSPKSSGASNSKKIITIKADELINMTKEKKVIITDSRPISNARFFEGKLYTEDQKDELAQKVNNKLQEAKKKADLLVHQLKKVNEDIDKYNKLLGSLHKTWPVH